MSSERNPGVGNARRDLVVIGASAGGVETLRKVVAGLPADFPAAICIVLHIAPASPSFLASILQRAGKLPCRPARDGDPLRAGEILVAPPDHHLVIDGDHVRVTIGPRENGHRPAVDVLFRSAAATRDGRVIGVVLSGTRDDGAAGLAVIKERGGAAIVQDPAEALYPGMPANALSHVAVDAVVSSDQVARTLAAMVRGERVSSKSSGAEDQPGQGGESEPFTTVCPECGGVLTERVAAGVTQWGCRVGHRYSSASLADAQAADTEAALWAAVRMLEDRRALLERMAARARGGSEPRSAQRFAARAHAATEQAQAVREALIKAATPTLQEAAEAHEPGDEEEGNGTA